MTDDLARARLSTVEKETQRRPTEPAPPIHRLCVEVAEGPDAGARFESDRAGPIAIGTATDNEVRLSDPTISRYHLELTRTEHGIDIADLGSLNGTYLGSARIHRAIVAPGTQIGIGDTRLLLTDGSAAERRDTPPSPPVPGIVAQSLAMREVLAMIGQLGRTATSVLLLGETGTGKELVARGIHDAGDRRDRPFVVVDCGSLPPALIASELFGHERGAFTGADTERPGAFEEANEGTIFLDEVGELPLTVQPALLGALERRRFKRVGGRSEISVDVRIIAATHRDLRAEVNSGHFRADLYYRLAVAKLRLPPLRDRPEDIPRLVSYFVEQFAVDATANPFGPQSMEAMIAHRWSGNVRELRNVVEAALSLGKVELEREARASFEGETEPLPPYKAARQAAIDRFEVDYLRRLIELAGDNASEAARRAKLDRAYLVTLLKRHGLR